MTPQEKELIQNVANKLKASPNKPKDPEADTFINQEIGSQQDIIYKLTQAVLVQEMALKDMKSKNDFLESSVEHYKTEANRGALSRMMGGSQPAPVPPQPPVRQPSAFGGFMQTAAGVAAGMVAGHLISNALFGNDEPATAATDAATDAAADSAADSATDTAAADNSADTQTAAADTAPADAAPDTGADSSFLGDNSGFASEYNDPNAGFGGDTGFGGDSGFGGDTGFGGDNGFGGDDTFANNSGFGGEDDSFGGFDDSGFDDSDY